MSYTRPDFDAADGSWAGAAEYTRPAYDAANTTFEEGGDALPVAIYALAAQTISLPVQPATVILTLENFIPEGLSPVVFALNAFSPVLSVPLPGTSLALTTYPPILGVVLIPLSIEFRHLAPVPWIMPMTSPIYPPAATLTLTPPLPGVTIRGFWSPHDALFGWAYDSGTDTISIPLSSLFELTAGQAHATTGDWRAVVLALVNSIWDSYVEMDDPPRALVLDYNPGYMMTAGSLAGAVKAEYTATTYLNFPDKTLADEP